MHMSKKLSFNAILWLFYDFLLENYTKFSDFMMTDA